MEHSKMQSNDRQPLTVAHGKRLYEQAKHMNAQIEELKRALTEPADPPMGGDPIAEITALLQNLTIQAQHQLAEMQSVSAKLDAVLGALGIGDL
jgi:hypothetical protein